VAAQKFISSPLRVGERLLFDSAKLSRDEAAGEWRKLRKAGEIFPQNSLILQKRIVQERILN
ncbi:MULTISPECIES: hypothetical protein, partial [unclassified Anabaena]|uniref:hypothetical protein n=1 Tax=unclassified Anabaena TaxID=2619674 RepID=UPI001E5B0F93